MADDCFALLAGGHFEEPHVEMSIDPKAKVSDASTMTPPQLLLSSLLKSKDQQQNMVEGKHTCFVLGNFIVELFLLAVLKCLKHVLSNLYLGWFSV